MRSSLFSTIVSILAIFIVIMFAVVDIENTAMRQTFSPNFSHNQATTSNEKGVTEKEEKTVTNPGTQEKTSPQIALDDLKNSPLADTKPSDTHPSDINASDANSSGTQNTSQKEIIYSGSGNSLYPVLMKSPENDVQYALNFEKFQKAGLTNFSLQRKPFTGTLFHDFHFDELAALNVNQQALLKTDQETQLKTTILESWEFKCEDKQMADEIYTLLKNKFISSLGVSINETNQFGQQSFYINFEEKSENVFLVVKQSDSVYALSYLKDNHELIKALFKLI